MPSGTAGAQPLPEWKKKSAAHERVQIVGYSTIMIDFEASPLYMPVVSHCYALCTRTAQEEHSQARITLSQWCRRGTSPNRGSPF